MPERAPRGIWGLALVSAVLLFPAPASATSFPVTRTPGTADKADLDLLPTDPNSIVVGCETKTRH